MKKETEKKTFGTVMKKFMGHKIFPLLLLYIAMVIIFTVWARIKGNNFIQLSTVRNILQSLVVSSFLTMGAGCLLIADDDVAAVKTVISAYKLAQDTALDGEKTLTGVITKIDTPYSEQYKNITVTITVAGISDKTIQCFRMVGEGAANLAEGQVITVTGTLKNFKGTVEFDAKCTFKLG